MNQTTPRIALPVMFSVGALLVAATTCLTVSYAGVEEAAASRGAARALDEKKQSTLAAPHAWIGGHDEEVEEQTEKNEAPRRAEEAREETEEEREEQKSSMGQGRTADVILRAHLEVINARAAIGGIAGDPCVHSVELPPAEHSIELRLTRRGAEGAAGEVRSLGEVTSAEDCASAEGFYRDVGRAPSRVIVCPEACAWARASRHGLSVDVLVSGL